MSPDCGFFEAFLSRFDAWQLEGARAGAADKVLGVTHKELQDRRDVKECERERYAEILNEAYSGDGMNDPVSFLLTQQAQLGTLDKIINAKTKGV